MANDTPTVIIIGAGFGGLRAARALRRAPVHVTLIDRNNYHLFQPLLYQVATAGLSPEEIARPVRGILRGQRNLDFHLAEVTGVNLEQRKVHTTKGALPYDYLIVAAGGETNFFGIESAAKNGFGLKTLGDAVAIRNHVLRQFEQAIHITDAETRRALLTFAVVGGGPSGVESAGALAELIRLVLVKDYPRLDLKDVRVLLLEAANAILPGFPGPLREHAAETLWRKHVEMRFGALVTDYDGERLLLKGGEVIPARTMIWAAGARAVSWLDGMGVRQARQGRVVVLPTLQLPDWPEVYVIGDAAHLEAGGEPLPMMAPVAIQQAEVAAQNIQRTISQQTPLPFQFKDPGSLATIGRNAAIARLGRFQFHGFFAWLAWLVVHLIQLIGFRNRLLVLINWAWDYLFYERAVRIILDDKVDGEV